MQIAILKNRLSIFTVLSLLFASVLQAQKGNPTTGAWYSYFFTKSFDNSRFGIMGDVQLRNFEVVDDFQQAILRAGLFYNPKDTPFKIVAGYSYFTTGTFGENDATFYEHRPYQDLIWNQKGASRIYLLHRIRAEERIIENQDFRMRYRYMLNAKLALNAKEIVPKTFYLWTAGEVFINGKQTEVTPNLFDRLWFFAGTGYKFTPALTAELAYMREVTPAQTKGQLIVSVLQNF